MNELVSIIVPVFNMESQLATLIDCVKKQSYKAWELILIDDGSTDKTPEICDQACREDARISCFHQTNAGVSMARNCGMEIAKGVYITFLDGDDKIDINYIETLVTACHNADISICDVVVKDKEEEIRRFTVYNDVLSRTEAINYLLSREGINSGPYGKMFRKEILNDIRFPALRYYEDMLFNRDAFSRAEKIVSTNKTAYYYIANNQGAMSNIKKIGLLDIVTATENILSFLKERRYLSSDCVYVTASHLMEYVMDAVGTPSEIGNELIRKSKRLFQKYIKDILCCSSFPMKEKVVFLLFSFGWLYRNKKITKC